MMKLHTQKRSENLLYLLLWTLLYLLPLASELFYSVSRHNSFEWEMVTSAWSTITFFLLAFCVHNFFIAPLLVYRKRIWLYLGILTLLLVGMSLGRSLIRPHEPHRHHFERHERFNQREPRNAPEERPAPADAEFRPAEQGPNRARGERPRREGKNPEDMPFMPGSREMIMCCIVLTLCGSNIGVKYYFKSADDRKRMEQLEKHNLSQQLTYLKYQISPHFFMNTLNNIHALVSMDPPKAEEMIEVLSRLMRYVLYEADKPLVPLKQEVDFLNNYIELMRVRYTHDVKIAMDTPPQLPTSFIPPLIFTTIVENAFKHGVSYNHRSFIHISVEQVADRLVFRCHNSRHPKPNDGKPGGVGLNNVKQRLKLLFHTQYKLEILPTETDYLVRLSIPIMKSSKFL